MAAAASCSSQLTSHFRSPVPSSPLPSPPSSCTLTIPCRRGRIPLHRGQTGFFTPLGRLIKEKAKSNVVRLFSGFSKTGEHGPGRLLLLCRNLADTDRSLDDPEDEDFFQDRGVA